LLDGCLLDGCSVAVLWLFGGRSVAAQGLLDSCSMAAFSMAACWLLDGCLLDGCLLAA